jgi:hypothetical protein
LQKKSKPKPRKPTIDEFLTFRPRRNDFEWSTDEKGLVHITVPKFHSNLGKKFCKLLRREEVMTADMDELGSVVWKHSDGRNTVADILQILEKEFPGQENLDQRLFLFIQQMGQLQYLTY